MMQGEEEGADDDRRGLLPTTPRGGVSRVDVETGGGGGAKTPSSTTTMFKKAIATTTTSTTPATFTKAGGPTAAAAATTTLPKLGLVGMITDVWNTNGLLLLMVSCLCFSLMNVCAKSAERRLPALEAVAARVAFMVPVNTLVLHLSDIDFRGHPDTRWLMVQRGCFGFCSFTLLLQAVQWLPTADAVVTYFTYPLVTCAMAAVVLGDRFTSLDVGAGLLAALGVVLVVQPPLLGFPDREPHPASLDDTGGGGGGAGAGSGSVPTHASYDAGVAAALCAAFCGGVSICTVRIIGKREHALVLLQWYGMVCVPAVIATQLALGVAFLVPTPRETAMLAGTAIFAYGGQIFLNRGIQTCSSVALGTVATFAEVPLTTLWGAIALGELPGGVQVLGMCVVGAATLALAAKKVGVTTLG
eukprot:CAMPEP_0197601906 /NCGR_PEP_ID=MMETSP1326-20131121/36164_1 /TAXON_ID=1155430 /ORGANISM="Genus nov. species nov., Strain RCC2288" /LENGTH=414 /DNA_ID=CAMNT_0043169181 /DNA_START=37 /DNA_END=1278 /DNA_ORIENTATION=+